MTRKSPKNIIRLFYPNWWSKNKPPYVGKEKLMGFVVLDLALQNLPMMIIGAYEHRPPVFSDLLYDAVIRHCCDQGFKKLVFGHSYGKGLFEYKQKWGECDVQPGVWEIMLAHPDSRLGTNSHPWLARNLGKQEFRTISW